MINVAAVKPLDLVIDRSTTPPRSQRYNLTRLWITNEIKLNIRQDPAQQIQMPLTHIIPPRAFTLIVNLQVIQNTKGSQPPLKLAGECLHI